MPSPVARDILSDLQPRDSEWFAHDILVHTVPKILKVGDILNDLEVELIRGAANQYGSDVAIPVDLALTAHRKHVRVCRRHTHP